MKSSSVAFLVIIFTLLAGAVFLGVRACREYGKAPEAEERVARFAIPVHVHQVKKGEVEDVVYVTGCVEPSERVDVIAKIPSPGKLVSAKVRKGDYVKRGQTLAVVDRDVVGARYRHYGVEAPSSGIVASITEDRGALVSPQVPVAVIVDIDKVKVKTSVVEADLSRVKTGTSARVRVDAFPGEAFNGQVSSIPPVLDQFSHTAQVEITVDNQDHRLLPGMYAEIELVADVHEDVPVVPKRAVLKRKGKDLAYLYNEDDSRIHLVELELGFYDLKEYEVRKGLKEGDLVVDRNLVVLKDRTRVSLANIDEIASRSSKDPE